MDAGAVAGLADEMATVREAARSSPAASSDVAVGAADSTVFGLHFAAFLVVIYSFEYWCR